MLIMPSSGGVRNWGKGVVRFLRLTLSHPVFLYHQPFFEPDDLARATVMLEPVVVV
jgi:hypothetical protein